MTIRINTGLVITGLIIGTLIPGGGCDGPPAPVPNQWEFRSPLNVGAEAIACGDDGVFIMGPDEINLFNREKVIKQYEAPVGTLLYEIGVYADKGWAVGTRAQKGIIIRYDGTGWYEIDLPANSIKCILKVSPVSPDTCWMETYPDDGLVFWDGKNLRVESDSRNVAGVVYSPAAHTLYGRRLKSQSVFELVVTNDDGRTWITEEMPRELNGFDIGSVLNMVTAGDALYYIAKQENAEERGGFEWMIIKRTGPPGKGEYEISFASPISQDFEGFQDFAFGSPAHGIAVGHGTSVAYTAPRWYKEEKPSQQFWLVTADPRGGFWAIGSPPFGIYFHP